MCVPISTGTSLFNPEYLQLAKNKDLILKPSRREGYKYFVGVDPAISTDGDYNVITVLEVDSEDNKNIVYIDRSKNVEFRENINKVKLIIGKIFNPEVILFETNTFAKSFTQELRNVADLNVHDFNTTRKKKEEVILNLQMTLENQKMNFPYGNEESRRVTSALVEELSMFAITERGRFEGIGAHDDMVMSLALANAATFQITDNFILLDDMEIFGSSNRSNNRVKMPFLGLNFKGDNMDLSELTPEEIDEVADNATEQARLKRLSQQAKDEMETLTNKSFLVGGRVLSELEEIHKISTHMNINATEARKN